MPSPRLKLKLQSPLPKTMVMDMANGADGYIPPPEQHVLGGYNTWAKRGAGLEIDAEPKITEVALQLLEKVAARARRPFKQSRGPAFEVLLKAGPAAYWRLDEFGGSGALDSSGQDRDALYEPGIAFFLEGLALGEFLQGKRAESSGPLCRRDGCGHEFPIWVIGIPWPSGSGMACRQMLARSAAGSSHAAATMAWKATTLALGGTSHPGKLTFLRGENGEGGTLVAGSYGDSALELESGCVRTRR